MALNVKTKELVAVGAAIAREMVRINILGKVVNTEWTNVFEHDEIAQQKYARQFMFY